MNVLWALLIVLACFALPIILFLPTRRAGDGFGIGVILALAAFIWLGISTSQTTYEPVDRSKVSVARMTGNGESVLIVNHPKYTFRTRDAYLYENFEDTTKVEVVIKTSKDVWRMPTKDLLARPK